MSDLLPEHRIRFPLLMEQISEKVRNQSSIYRCSLTRTATDVLIMLLLKLFRKKTYVVEQNVVITYILESGYMMRSYEGITEDTTGVRPKDLDDMCDYLSDVANGRRICDPSRDVWHDLPVVMTAIWRDMAGFDVNPEEDGDDGFGL
jgi:hypothetical protein